MELACRDSSFAFCFLHCARLDLCSLSTNKKNRRIQDIASGDGEPTEFLGALALGTERDADAGAFVQLREMALSVYSDGLLSSLWRGESGMPSSGRKSL